MKKPICFVIVSCISFALISFIAFAADVNINILIPASGSTFNVGDPVTVSGQANLLSGDTDPTKYGVTIDWNDTTNTTCLPLSGTSNPYSYTTSPSNNHVYSSSGAKTIKAMLFHQCDVGQDPSKADAIANVNINIIIPPTTTTTSTTTTSSTTTTTLPTCGISINPDSISFGDMKPTDVSTSDQVIVITNNGNSQTTDLIIQGSTWSSGANSFSVSQTHYDETVSNDPYDSMKSLTGSDDSLVNNKINSGSSTSVYFKLGIPVAQAQGSYTQTITFTSSC